MQWSDDGIILSTRKHGENSVIVDLLTRHNGRHAGMVRGGRGKRYRPILQIGNRVSARWKARLPEHLGMYALEPLHLRAALVLDDRLKLLALQSVCTLCALVAEREPHPRLFEATEIFIKTLVEEDDWQPLLVRWELGLLGELGYGLDLTSCAVTGVSSDLTFVSPRSGRAVSESAAEPYKEKLLRLPAFLVEQPSTTARIEARQLHDGLVLTRYFLEKNVLDARGISLPYARISLEKRLG